MVKVTNSCRYTFIDSHFRIGANANSPIRFKMQNAHNVGIAVAKVTNHKNNSSSFPKFPYFCANIQYFQKCDQWHTFVTITLNVFYYFTSSKKNAKQKNVTTDNITDSFALPQNT